MKPVVAEGYTLYEEGQYPVTILSVEEQPNQWYKEGDPEHRKTRWVWTFEMPDGASVIKYYTGTSVGSKKANLTKLVAAILGKKVADLTKKDKESFDTDDAIGKKVMINIIHVEDDEGQTWHRISRVMPIKEKKDKTPF